MKRFFHKLFDSKSKQTKRTPRRKSSLPLFEPLEDRRLTVVSAFGNAPATGVGTWVDGVVRLQPIDGSSMVYTGSGSLLTTGRHILTAAHNLKNEKTGLLFDEVKVTFELPSGPITIPVPKSNFRIHEDYNSAGDVNDIAVIILPQLAPASSPRYDLYTGGDEFGQTFLMAGYGRTGNGTAGATVAAGTRRYGYNRIDSTSKELLNFDFDNPNLDTTAVPNEANLAPGDSGGPIFLGNRIAGVIDSGAATNNFGFQSTSNITRVYAYAAWIDRITGMQNPDVVLDMNKLSAGNSGSPDTIEARVNGEYMELLVNGSLVVKKSACRVGTLTIIGSNDNDTIKVDGRLALPLKPIDGRGGQDKLEINDRAGLIYWYQVSATRVGTADWSVGMNGIENLALYTSPKTNEVTIGSLVSGRTTIYGSDKAEKFIVDGQNGSLDDLATSDALKSYGALEIVGGAGADSLVIREGAASSLRSTISTFTVTDTNVFRNRTQPNYDGWRSKQFGLSTDYSGIESLSIQGSNVGNQFIVKSTPAATVVSLQGSDVADTFAVGNRQYSLSSVRQLQIDGKSGHDVLTFVDTASPAIKPISQTVPTYALESSSLTRSQSVRFDLNKPSTQIESRYTYKGIEDFSLWGSNLGGLYNIQGAVASADVKVYGGSGDDTFLFTSLYEIQGITVNGGAGLDRAALDDRWNPAVESGPINYAVGPTYVQVTTQDGSTNTLNFLLGQNAVTPGNIEELTLYTSDGDDLVDIYGTWAGLPLAIHMGLGNDQATLRNWSPWVLNSDLTISGDDDYDRLIVDDTLSNAAQTYEITPNTIGRTGEIPISYDALEFVELNAGNSDDAFYVYGTMPGSTAINAGEGNDGFYLQDYAGTLDSLQGWLHLDGQGGDFNYLSLSDVLNPVGQTYDIDADAIHRSGVASITYANQQMISLTAGEGDDVFAFGHNDGGVPIYLDANTGRDTLDYSHYDVDVYVDLASWIATDTGWAGNFENVIGGNGNDQLFGDDNDNLLLGGAGIDLLDGRGGRDLLIGGWDADTLFGGSDDDILIGGSTAHDADWAALLAIVDEWSDRELSYQDRLDHLRGITEGGKNGFAFLTADAVLDDSAGDYLEGSDGLDWFFDDLAEIADALAEEHVGA